MPITRIVLNRPPHDYLLATRPEFGRAEFFARYGFDPAKKLVVLLPGSRRGELRRHAPVLAETVARLRTSLDIQFALVLAESLDRSDLDRSWPGSIAGLTVLDRDGYEAMAAADVVLPGEELAATALRLLASHPLRAADALQLAAALVWARGRPAGHELVSLDERLRTAATLEGFTVT